ncbi:MAG TPA: Flp family type IVb pilin [Xanthobacteraceae bacterium]|nr:Flp family type IVb pilin [Xanthobacteraceae bacterium]
MQPTTLTRTIARRLRSFRRDDSGGTAIEYALIAAGVGVCIVATIWNLGETVNTTFYEKLGSMF